MTSNVCYNETLLIFTHHVFQSRGPLKRIPEFPDLVQHDTNGVTNLSKVVLPTFCKHVIVVELANSSCILELGAKFSLLDLLCIAYVVVELDVDASNRCK
jgi:hypothetical protein